MNHKNLLFVSTSSLSRILLLKKSRICFILLDQNADEQICKVGLTLAQQVREIALQKMAHVVIPKQYESGIVFVLTADTMCEDSNGTIIGKPDNRFHAHQMIKACRNGFVANTAFCIDKKQWDGCKWIVIDQTVEVVRSEYVIDIPDNLIDMHIDTVDSMRCAGGATIEDFGMQFAKEIHGSYSNIIGLPLYEVRMALQKMGFQIAYTDGN